MNSENKEKIEAIALPNRGILASGDRSKFQEHMLKRISDWENFEYNDWLYFLELIKNDPFKIYSFFPFVYRILGIQILHKFEKLESVNEESKKYVNHGMSENRFFTNYLTGSDLTLYQREKTAMNKTIEIRNRLTSQGAIPNNNYTLGLSEHIGNWKKYRIYRRRINREDFTTISIEDSKQDKYLFEERDLTQFKKE